MRQKISPRAEHVRLLSFLASFSLTPGGRRNRSHRPLPPSSMIMSTYAGACGFLGKRVPNDLVFGEPIEPACAKPGEPTEAEVQVAHTAYIAALKTLFDEHKAGLGYGDRELLVA